MNSRLSQLCCKCKKLKDPSLGRFIRSHAHYNSTKFICCACDEKDEIPRDESTREREVRQCLQKSGQEFKPQFKLGTFTFDFALLRLRMLIELNPVRWRRTYSQRRRCDAKAKLARQEGWELVQLKTGHVDLKLDLLIAARKAELGIE